LRVGTIVTVTLPHTRVMEALAPVSKTTLQNTAKPATREQQKATRSA